MQKRVSNVDIFMINIQEYLIRIDTTITKLQPYNHPLTLDHEGAIFLTRAYSDVLRYCWMKVQSCCHVLFFKEFAKRATFFNIYKFQNSVLPLGSVMPHFPLPLFCVWKIYQKNFEAGKKCVRVLCREF